MFHLMSLGLMTLIAVYVIYRIILPLMWPKWLKIVLSLVIFFGTQRLGLLRFFLGLSTSEINPWLNYPLTYIHITIICLALLCLVVDIYYIIRFVIKGFRFSTRRANAGVMVLVACILGGQAYYAGTKVPDIRQDEIVLPKLDPKLNGLKIALLTDLHLGPIFDGVWLKEVVARTNAAKPDLIVIVGDVVDGNPVELRESAQPLADLQAPYGSWLAVGNHEYYSGLEAWLPEFKRLGLKTLLNQSEIVQINGSDLVLIGLTDSVASRFGFEMPNVEQALQATLHSSGLRIALAHRPDLAKAIAATKTVDLQLSGHTHGGLLWPIMPLIAAFNDGFVYGWYKLDELLLYVSSGSGLWAGLPMRLGVFSEVTILTLKNSK